MIRYARAPSTLRELNEINAPTHRHRPPLRRKAKINLDLSARDRARRRQSAQHRARDTINRRDTLT